MFQISSDMLEKFVGGRGRGLAMPYEANYFREFK